MAKDKELKKWKIEGEQFDNINKMHKEVVALSEQMIEKRNKMWDEIHTITGKQTAYKMNLDTDYTEFGFLLVKEEREKPSIGNFLGL